MSARSVLYQILFSCIMYSGAAAQAIPPGGDGALIGVWKGTSICQVKNSSCHDENVVYRISGGQGTDTFNISGNKIIDGKEIEMGVIPFKFNKTLNQLTASMNGMWTLNLKGNILEGTLVTNGTLFRIVKLTRQN